MNIASSIASILAITLVASLPGLVSADSRDDIEARIKKVGRINIASTPAAKAESAATAASAETTTAPASEAPAPAPATEDASSAAAPATTASVDAEGLYTGKCLACHGTGVAGAPVVGNAEQWTARISKGTDTLHNNAIGGINAMPPKGGAMDLSDDQVKAIVDFMIAKSQ